MERRSHISSPVPYSNSARGMTLIEMLVAIAVIVVAFVGFYDVFRASLEYVQTAGAREGAVSLATERMEEMRAMTYDSLGTVEGIPNGTLAQNETITQDGIAYDRRTLIQYVDDPADGTGADDTNGITADYKRAKVEVSWPSQSGTESVSLVSNFIPDGMESNNNGGTLLLKAIDAAGSPLSGATVHIKNGNTVDVTTYTDLAGAVEFPGTPPGSGYHVTVSKSGYSTAQTYPVSGQNQNPNPGDLTVADGEVTSQTFAVDRLAELLVRTYAPIEPASWTDAFNGNNLSASSNTTVSGGALLLTADADGNYPGTGTAQSAAVAPAYLASWKTLSWHESVPAGTSVVLHVFDQGGTLLPDSVLPGNAAGFSTSPVSLSGISTSTYTALMVGATLTTTDQAQTPQILDWTFDYTAGPTPLPNIPFTLQGVKTIGTTSGGSPIYKMSEALSTDAAAQYATSTLEWDSYTASVAASTGYDVSSYCPAQPLPVSPGSSVRTSLYLVAHTTNSLMVYVTSGASGAPIAGATVALSDSGYSGTATTDSCGNAFFSGIPAASDYTANVSASGYSGTAVSNVSVSGRSQINVAL